MLKKKIISFLTSAAMAVTCLGGGLSGLTNKINLVTEPLTAAAYSCGIAVENVEVNYGTTFVTLNLSATSPDTLIQGCMFTITYPEEFTLVNGPTGALSSAESENSVSTVFLESSGIGTENFSSIDFKLPANLKPGIYPVEIQIHNMIYNNDYVFDYAEYSGSVTIKEPVTTTYVTTEPVTTTTSEPVTTTTTQPVTTTAEPVTTTSPFIPGDISGNDRIDLQDAIYIAKALLPSGIKLTDDEKTIADYNQDGIADIMDMIEISKYILKNPDSYSDLVNAGVSCKNAGVKVGSTVVDAGSSETKVDLSFCGDITPHGVVFKVKYPEEFSLNKINGAFAKDDSVSGEVSAVYISGGTMSNDFGSLTFDTSDCEAGTYPIDIEIYMLDNDGEYVSNAVGYSGSVTIKEPVTTAPVTSLPSSETVTTVTKPSTNYDSYGIAIDNVEVDYGSTSAVLGISLTGYDINSCGCVFTITYPEEFTLVNGPTGALSSDKSENHVSAVFVNGAGMQHENFSSIEFSLPENLEPGIYPVEIKIENLDNNGEYVSNPVGYSGSVTIKEPVTTAPVTSLPSSETVTTVTKPSTNYDSYGIAIDNVEVDYGSTSAVLYISMTGNNISSTCCEFTITFPEEFTLVNYPTNALAFDTHDNNVSAVFVFPNGLNSYISAIKFSSIEFSLPENLEPGIYPVEIKVDKLDNYGEYVSDPVGYSGSVTIKEPVTTDPVTTITTTATTSEPVITTTTISVTTTTTQPVTTTTEPVTTTVVTDASEIFEIRENNGKIVIINCDKSIVNVDVPVKINDNIVSKINDYALSGENIESVKFENPSIKITDSETTINENAVIYGYWESTAHEYANKYNRAFVSLNGEPDYIPGDISGNGRIDIVDAITVCKHVMGTKKLTAEEQKIADFNGDGVVNILDAIGIAKELMK